MMILGSKLHTGNEVLVGKHATFGGAYTVTEF